MPVVAVWKLLPIKQGLKQKNCYNKIGVWKSLKATSNKTRIETKKQLATQNCSASLKATSNKTRIET
jgi:hypothetical protein